MASDKGPDDNDSDFLIPDDEDEQEDRSALPPSKKSNVIPNFRGKVPEPELPDSKGPVQVEWDSEDSEDSEDDDDDDDEEDEEEEEEGGEEEEEAGEGEREGKGQESVAEGDASNLDGDGQEVEITKKRRSRKKKDEDEVEEEILEEEEEWNFPVDRENWTEEDLEEEWADPTPADDTVGRDPELAEDDEELIAKLEKDGRAPPQRPYYVPYRKWYPPIPEDHPDIDSPEAVVEELERMEEFLVWASYIFEDGSSYEGTVWDDLAHGKGVYTTPMELCRYEGEWFQNMMDGHGVLEVDLPVADPPPGSELERKMKAEGKILKTDFLDPEDKEWLRMDLEDTLAYNPEAIDPNPFEDDDLWVKYFGEKPEKGHYKYAGQWKHNRMHGCGVYELNGRQIWGKFYFGEMLPEEEDCNDKISAMHSALAEVAAAKARMFVNKPDGMVREVKGPFTDPQHPYMYEEDDMWMAPGFIHDYYKVPELWERYVEEVDKEREMWLNSFTVSPLRIPMPPELEYLWGKDEEFVVLTGPPEEGEDPESEGQEVLLHVPTGQIINWATTDEGNVRMFLQPLTKDGSVDPELALPLPVGAKEFYGEKATPADEEEDEGDANEGGNTLTEDEKLERKWKDEDEERKRRWLEEDTQRELRWAAKEEELELELELKELDRQLEDAVDEAEMLLKIEDLYGAGESSEDSLNVIKKGEILEEDQLEEDNLPQAGSTSGGEDKDEEDEQAQDDDDDDDGGGGDDEDDEDDEDDDEDPKPQSFGTVAMASPQDSGVNDDSMERPPFPTVFASMSVVSQATLKQAMNFAVKKARKSWVQNLFGMQAAPNIVKKTVIQPLEPRLECMQFSPLREVNLKVSDTCTTSRLRTTLPRQVQPKAKTTSRPRTCYQAAKTQVWMAPTIEFLSLSLPLEV